MSRNTCSVSCNDEAEVRRDDAPADSRRWLYLPVQLFCILTLLLLLSACSALDGSIQPTATPDAQKVNVFGTAANHVHAMMALPGNVLLVATHYGLYRSADTGKSWSGPNQGMGDMMTSSLTSSPMDRQHVYLLAEHSLSSQTGTIGLYASSDGGSSWQPASKASDTGKMYTIVAGNRSANELYAYVPTKGANGFVVSQDGGKHFSSPGPLPFGRILGILALPGQPGQLLVYSNDGAARSSDGGAHWQTIKDFTSAVYNMTTSGPREPIYASGDQGIMVSKDGGKSFSMAYADARYSALTAVPDQPEMVYGKTGRMIYKSTDGGHSWKTLPQIKGNLENLVPDPQVSSRLFLSLSYPCAVYQFDQQNPTWTSLTPKA
ncbi:WD40/YVTN/BNR-like repeat-containing protein [Dictyobacter aurantiacus]|uniref:WD40/YVTN/BNR-like repeat-containing protein n=1 Tax=Dictyobacter aurantiacus TaxID=1936993 RepID=UPI000F81A09E|nr:sialidase family protein [Dictyobacter aurantiacus]